VSVKQQDGSLYERRGHGHYPGIAGWDDAEEVLKVANLVWDTNTLTWVKMTQPGGGPGGGGMTLAEFQGELPLPVTGPLTDAELRATEVPVALANGRTRIWDGVDTALVTAAGALVIDGSGVTQPISAAALPLPAGAATSALQLPNSHDVTIDNGAGAAAVNIQDGGNSITIDGAVTANPTRPATATLSNVNDTNVSTTLLAANAGRLGASIHNDSTEILYVKFGITASATSFTVKMVADAHYEVPFGYTGRIDGIWAVDGAGAARITELTA
jgi:hypothetical protein